MTNEPVPDPEPDRSLQPATSDELTGSLAYALRFSGRKRVTVGDELMARIVAERLVDHLERAGYVVMKKPGLQNHSIWGPKTDP